ncbi:hypothetical protein AXF42_Ash009739 [Apostasia shenzhenica]|uniref:Fe2OG dioxygenase domain-containing protein n=1 Tax=Apostasia shenzhenica TaxID=1088818 RepID=A0A2I0AWY1_9ASPA|nr:hypothetical protein AXF42_Ash009739 [Apostasia shenzhenica]
MAGRGDEVEFGRKKKRAEEIDRKWPAVKPKRDLQINRLKGTNLFTIPNFLTAYEAKAFIEAAESIGFAHQGSLGPAKGEAYRDNDRTSMTDLLLAESLWESGLKKAFVGIKVQGKAAVGLNPNIRLYRYKVGQRFGRHVDESVDLEHGRQTLYTLLIYLNGSLRLKGKNNFGANEDSSIQPLVGGETVFYDQKQGLVAEVAPVEGMALLHLHGAKCMLHEARVVAPVEGMALLHLHGAKCMLHEARVVSEGVKYVLRTDVAFA